VNTRHLIYRTLAVVGFSLINFAFVIPWLLSAKDSGAVVAAVVLSILNVVLFVEYVISTAATILDTKKETK
jgi:hypothetical protein